MYTWHLPQSTSAFWQLKTTSDVLMHTGIWNSPPAINPSSGYLTRKVKRPFNLSARWRLRHLTESRGLGSNRHKTEEHRKLRLSQPPQDAPPTPSPSNRKNEIAGIEMASTTSGCTAHPQPKQQKKWESGNWDGLNHPRTPHPSIPEVPGLHLVSCLLQSPQWPKTKENWEKLGVECVCWAVGWKWESLSLVQLFVTPWTI